MDEQFDRQIHEQIKEQMTKAFWDLLESELAEEPPRLEHVKVLLNEIIEILCGFVPSKPNIHEKIKADFEGEINWNMQLKLIEWLEKFQAPVHDRKTKQWKKRSAPTSP